MIRGETLTTRPTLKIEGGAPSVYLLFDTQVNFSAASQSANLRSKKKILRYDLCTDELKLS